MKKIIVIVCILNGVIAHGQNIFSHQLLFDVEYNPYRLPRNDFFYFKWANQNLEDVDKIYGFIALTAVTPPEEFQINFKNEIEKYINNDCSIFYLHDILEFDSLGFYKRLYYMEGGIDGNMSCRVIVKKDEIKCLIEEEFVFTKDMYYHKVSGIIQDSCEIDSLRNPLKYEVNNNKSYYIDDEEQLVEIVTESKNHNIYYYSYDNNKLSKIVKENKLDDTQKIYNVTHTVSDKDSTAYAVTSTNDTLFRITYEKRRTRINNVCDAYFVKEVVSFKDNNEKEMHNIFEYGNSMGLNKVIYCKSNANEFIADYQNFNMLSILVKDENLNYRPRIYTNIQLDKNVVRPLNSPGLSYIQYRDEKEKNDIEKFVEQIRGGCQ